MSKRLTPLEQFELYAQMLFEEGKDLESAEAIEQAAHFGFMPTGPYTFLPMPMYRENWLMAGNSINYGVLAQEIITEYGLTQKGSAFFGRKGTEYDSNGIRAIICNKIEQQLTGYTSNDIKQTFSLLRVKAPRSSGPRLKPVTAASLKSADLKPPEFIVNGFLPCGLTAIAAPPKTGKSYMCLALADAVASGKSFFGSATKQGKVLYFALEDGQYRIKQRLQQIGSSAPDDLNFIFKAEALLTEGLEDQIEQWIKEEDNPALVIIDTVGRVKGAGKHGFNAYEADTRQFSRLQEMAVQYGLSIVVITHLSKQKQYAPDDPFERITGSTGLSGVSDALWLIDGKRNGDKFLHVTGRDLPYSDYSMSFEDFRWRIIGETEELRQMKEEEEYSSNPIVATISELLEENGGTYEGVASSIFEEIGVRKKVYPCDSPRALSVELRKLAPMLLERSQIITIPPQTNKRVFKFTKDQGKLAP